MGAGTVAQVVSNTHSPLTIHNHTLMGDGVNTRVYDDNSWGHEIISFDAGRPTTPADPPAGSGIPPGQPLP
jgi:hypothetical protein